MTDHDAVSGASQAWDAQSGASVLAEDADFDAVSAATRWSMGMKRNPEVPLPGQSMTEARDGGRLVTDAATLYEKSGAEAQAGNEESAPKLYSNPKVDATSGATVGVATACRDLGVATLKDAAKRFGCNPPGER